jgi:hypothetical protein
MSSMTTAEMEAEARQERLTIATIIAQQLGGAQFRAMTGARNLVALERKPGTRGGLQFDLPRFEHTKVRRVIVELSDADTYTLSFWALRPDPAIYGIRNPVLLETVPDVYAEDLPRVFREKTGLELTMPRFVRQ